MHIVYLAVNVKNGKPYVGMTSNSLATRMSQHKRASVTNAFYRAIRKHGWDSFEWSVLYVSQERQFAFPPNTKAGPCLNRWMRYRDLVGQEFDIVEIIDLFIDFAISELELSETPHVILTSNGELGTTFGSYDPNDDTVYVEIANRHPMDILRSLAHELVHFRQDLANELHADSGKDGSEHENEANAEAGRIMRKFGKRKPELFRAAPLPATEVLLLP